MTDRKDELKAQLEKLAYEGQAAFDARDMQKCADVHTKMEPLLREMAVITGDNDYNLLADKGQKLVELAAMLQELKQFPPDTNVVVHIEGGE